MSFLSLQGIPIVRAAAGVGKSIFVGSDGTGYWCGEGMGELKNVREDSSGGYRTSSWSYTTITMPYFLCTACGVAAD